MQQYDAVALAERYEKLTLGATASCTLLTELVGGMSADEAGVRAFVTHHLDKNGQITSKEGPEGIEKAVQRILQEEVGERNLTPESGELEERLTYGVFIIRRSTAGPWIGDWMVKACIKAAASRLGLFVTKRGSKGDVAEMGRVQAVGNSLLMPGHPERVHLVDTDGHFARTYFREIKGRVSTPQGSVSIVSHRECVSPGARFYFNFRWYAGSKLKTDDVVNIFAATQNIGLGSAKAFECGKFRIDRLVLNGAEAE